MQRCADYLATGLIDAGTPLSHDKFQPRGGGNSQKRGKEHHSGVRVLPVYVLSLQQGGIPTLVDDTGLYGVSKEAAVVLQHSDSVPLPFFSSRRQMHASAEDVTAPLIAAITSALTGIAPPATRYSKQHSKTTFNYLWSLGYSPFPPFSSSSTFSQVLVDMAVRNGVVWRLDSAVEAGRATLQTLDDFAGRYIFDSLGERLEPSQVGWLDRFYAGDTTVTPPEPSFSHSVATNTLRAIHAELVEVQQDLSSVSELLYRAHISEAFFKAEVCLAKARDLRQRAQERLQNTEWKLACCSMQHQLLPRREWVHWVRAALVGIITVAVMVLILLRDPERRGRLQQEAVKRWRRN